MDKKELVSRISLLISRINSTDYVHIQQLKNDVKIELSLLLNDIKTNELIAEDYNYKSSIT